MLNYNSILLNQFLYLLNLRLSNVFKNCGFFKSINYSTDGNSKDNKIERKIKDNGKLKIR